ncbi:hypothetical protein AB0I00_16590 [Streptomyces sp. NPDC050803]|uniref:hypothetical protein n=1 Tax=unclassified Streptomyces TaxID=2593676 RepID=UPI003413F025
MSRTTRKRTYARMAAVLPVLGLALGGFTVPSASAAAPTPCEAKDGGYYCDMNDIASTLSGLLSPVFKITCIDPQVQTTIICRVNEDNTPFSG